MALSTEMAGVIIPIPVKQCRPENAQADEPKRRLRPVPAECLGKASAISARMPPSPLFVAPAARFRDNLNRDDEQQRPKRSGKGFRAHSHASEANG